MKKQLLFVAMATFFWGSIIGCKDKDPEPQPNNNTGKGSIQFQVDNVVGAQDLKLDTDTFSNALGEKFTVSLYKYYLSNFIFHKKDGTVYTQPVNYYLMNESDASSLTFTISDIPVGDYDSVEFMIGVDEARNKMGAQTGALDPTNGMYWGWLGYIMAKLEGYSPNAGNGGKVLLHVGGYEGLQASQRMVGLKLPAMAKVSNNNTAVVKMKSDVLEWFTEPYDLSFTQYYDIMNPGNEARKLSINYSDMFTVTEVK